MKTISVFVCTWIAAFAAPTEDTEDTVIAKLDGGGPRYQNMSGPHDYELVDLWFKESDLAFCSQYDPTVNNSYHLYTRNNLEKSQVLSLMSKNTLARSNYDSNKKTVVLVHGWGNVLTSDFNVVLRNSYLAAEDVNLIVVDWSVGAAGYYIVAMHNVFRSGEHASKFLNWLIEATNGDINKFHIIGHSLGAHQAGIIGRHLGGKVPYITGLDPAMPGWITHSQAFSPDVAKYAEVIHTDVGMSGIISPVGHVDFYPNGGRDMPGCDGRSCNHHRAVFYMGESLKTGGFLGRQCSNLLQALTGLCEGEGVLKMGGPTPKTGSTGIYYLTTNAESPFSKS